MASIALGTCDRFLPFRDAIYRGVRYLSDDELLRLGWPLAGFSGFRTDAFPVFNSDMTRIAFASTRSMPVARTPFACALTGAAYRSGPANRSPASAQKASHLDSLLLDMEGLRPKI